MKKYCLYLRVSTKVQKHGKDAQRMIACQYASEDLGEYLAGNGKHIVTEFSEDESGANNYRPELKNAIDYCKEHGTTLLIGKLDRLSRNAGFLHILKDELSAAGVEVIAADMPEVLSNTLMLSVMAGMAQHEREIISKRTKEGLAAARLKGNIGGRKKGAVMDDLTKDLMSIAHKEAGIGKRATKMAAAIDVAELLQDAGQTLIEICKGLNKKKIATPTGKGKWSTSQLHRLLKQAANDDALSISLKQEKRDLLIKKAERIAAQ